MRSSQIAGSGQRGRISLIAVRRTERLKRCHFDMSTNYYYRRLADYSETRMPFELTLKYLLNSMNVFRWTSL